MKRAKINTEMEIFPVHAASGVVDPCVVVVVVEIGGVGSVTSVVAPSVVDDESLLK